MTIENKLNEITRSARFHVESDDYFLTLATRCACLASEKNIPEHIALFLDETAYELSYLANISTVVKREAPLRNRLLVTEQRLVKRLRLMDNSKKTAYRGRF